ncbi:hypothetical protein TNCV_3920401 [Trichonephila clavipes]|nr:hypothetical protein TNCV_3920401 [Trichonephila clavipes]
MDMLRVARVKTETGELVRPVQRFYNLELQEPEINLPKNLTDSVIRTRRGRKGRVVVYRASTPQVLGSINGLGKVDSAFHPRYIGSINEYQACLGS